MRSIGTRARCWGKGTDRWPPELKAMGDLLAGRIVGARLGPERRRRSDAGSRSDAVRAAFAANVAIRRATASPAVGRLNGPRGTLCYPGAVPGV
jgi:hypothetical protein